MKKLEDYVTSIPDFPEPGIIFRDVTTILQDADGLSLAVDGVRGMLRESFRERSFPLIMNWNTARPPLKCTGIPFSRARRSLSLMI